MKSVYEWAVWCCVVWLFLINILSFVAFGIDKRRAQKHRWRLPEAFLLLLSVLGGALGAWLGMKTFHHKTRHPKFYIGLPLIFWIELVIGILILLF